MRPPHRSRCACDRPGITGTEFGDPEIPGEAVGAEDNHGDEDVLTAAAEDIAVEDMTLRAAVVVGLYRARASSAGRSRIWCGWMRSGENGEILVRTRR